MAEREQFAGLSDEGLQVLLGDGRGEHIDADSPLGLTYQVIEANLARPDSARRSAMRRLLESGTPEDQFYACVLLVSWGDDIGFQTLELWARDPATAPGLESVFHELAVAVGRSRDAGGRITSEQRDRALDALLSLVGDYDVAAAVAGCLHDSEHVRALLPPLVAAVQRCLERVAGGVAEPFDILDDAAVLIGTMAGVDDAAAARAARQVMTASRRVTAATGTVAVDFDPLLTLASVESGGPQYQEVLTELTAYPDEEVRIAARESLAALRSASSAVAAPREKKSRFKWLTG